MNQPANRSGNHTSNHASNHNAALPLLIALAAHPGINKSQWYKRCPRETNQHEFFHQVAILEKHGQVNVASKGKDQVYSVSSAGEEVLARARQRNRHRRERHRVKRAETARGASV